MALTKEHLHAVMTATQEHRIEELRKLLGYPLKERDPEGSRFWYLRPGVDESVAEETCPFAVGFYSELNDATDQEIKRFLTSKEQQQEIYGHYIKRVAAAQPVMYLLLPEASRQGQVALVLPTEGGLRQRQIQTFDWSDHELLGRLGRLQQGTLKIVTRGMAEIPQIDWVFYPGVKTAQKLAQLMAEIARDIEQAIPATYATQGRDGYLHMLFESFKKELLPTLQLKGNDDKDYNFADIYAQTVAYGLFTARVFSYLKFKREQKKHPSYDTEPDFYRDNAWEYLPETNPFLRQLFRNISDQSPESLGEELVGAVSELLSVLRAAEMEAVLLDFQQKIGQEDIIIRFYEDFLTAYKPQMREKRGVYYTPQPVVSYIVRSVDHILKKDFGLKDGLADASKVQAKSPDGKTTETHKVLITDPAVGTATFLHEVINHIYNSFESKKEQWSDYVSQNLLPRLLGFELLMAPYAVAHMKLGLQLAELGYQFDTKERLRVYLTNTLQEAFRIPPAQEHFSSLFWGEADAANRIKETAPVMVILGNPPYSGHSANNDNWIRNLLKGKDTLTNQLTSNYFEVDGKPLGEKNPKWLNDDYVKFIRFAQWRIEKTGYGVLAFVTNHSYLDNPTFRGMRQSLMEAFDDIYVLDLHGNIKKKERCPGGLKDENVFDIQQGVVISIFVKRLNGKKESAKVHHAHLYGIRELYEENSGEQRLVGGKYHWLKKNDVSTTQWATLKPQFPFYLFVPQDTGLLAEYEQGWKVTEILPKNLLGFQTHRDPVAIAYEKLDLVKQVKSYLGKEPDSDSWSNYCREVDYRPFDSRIAYLGKEVTDRPRLDIVEHLFQANLALNLVRQTKANEWRHAVVSNKPTPAVFVEVKDGSSILPLYLYPKISSLKNSSLEVKRQPNLSQEFLQKLAAKLGYAPTPEAIFHYIYAIFHSPTYRTRYAEFLKIDFPRVPITSDNELFCHLASYGEELVALHLMTSPKLDNLITRFVESRSSQAIDSGYPKFQQGDVVLNRRGDRFTGVPENIWNFYVGGYQVCQKWLKDRKGRTLSNEDIQHYQRIIVALKETIELMAKIDATIPQWPIQ